MSIQKQLPKRIISVLLAILMVFTVIPQTIIQAEAVESTESQSTRLVIDTADIMPGETVTLNIVLENAPTIKSMTISNISYDKTKMTLKNVEWVCDAEIKNWNALHGRGVLTFGDNTDANGPVVKMTFAVNGVVNDVDVSVNCVMTITRFDDEQNEIPVESEVVAGCVRIRNAIRGDMNNDDKLNSNDAVYLLYHVSFGKEDYPIHQNGDMDGNGKVNSNDAVYLLYHISFGEEEYPLYEPCAHALRHVNAKEATCTEDGNIAYWRCDDCGKLFGDATGTSEISVADTIIEAAHAPGDDETCTEPQICTKCGVVLKAAAGHTEVLVPGYSATLEKEGLTDGIKCSVCGEWVVKQEVIDKLLPAQHSITYIIDAGDYIDQGDAYLQAQTIPNPNPKTYRENELVELKKLSTPGYTFDGWVDQTGTRWDVIPVGTNKNLVLYAKWTQNVYTVTFDTPDIDVSYTWYDSNLGSNVNLKNSAKYTIDTGLPLTNPKAYKYTFVGWSNDDGFIVNEIKPGTTGNITLRANWTSDRNRATSYSDYGDPIIIEDNERKQFLFVYDIGKIDNVPLYTYKRANGDLVMYNNTTVDFVETSTLKTEFKREDAQNIAKTVANATTRSSGWTLSEEWERVLSESQADKNKLIKSEERVDSKGKTVGNTYFVSNSEGGSSYASVESGSSSSSSAKITTEDSFGINTSYDKSTEKYCDAELSTGFKNETELSAGISAPVGIAKVEAGVKNTTTITADANLKSGRKDNEAFHVDTSSSSFVGTDLSSNNSSHYNAVTSNSTNWNSSNSYEKSADMSEETTVAAAIASEIERTTKYDISNALRGAKDNTESVSGTTSNETGYSNSVTVSEYFSEENVYVESNKDDHVGYHRLVEAGIVHVYAVVGYDIATASYYTYTFNVLEDDTYSYWDYSLNDPSFSDCENGLVTFEIPFEVNEYIAGVTGKTEGLEIDPDQTGYGCVKDFVAAKDFSGDVVVPQYLGADNLDDTFDPVVVKSFSANAFRGNTEIKTVILPLYVTEIPDYAFEGCTNLETVIAYGVTKIGDYAFKDCVNLGLINPGTSKEKYNAFMIDNMVTELGKGAFIGVNELKVMAYDSKVADAAINSGAKKITVDLTKLKDNYSGNKTIQGGTEYFGLIGGGKTFNELTINSYAKETFISNITFVNNSTVPLKLSSETVTLARVTVENAPGFALILSAENTALKLYRTVILTSMSNNSVLSKNVTLSKANSGITGTLNFNGKYLVNGEITNKSMLSKPENIVSITDDEYAKYTETVTISFNSNGGTPVDSIKTGYDTIAKEPDNPSKTAHAFLGWYTDAACTTAFDFNTPVTSDITLYAKWKLNEFTLTLDANGGAVSTTSMKLIYGEKYGDLPTASRNYYDFLGWFTDPNGGNQITSDTVFTGTSNITLYAHWRQHDVSGWVRSDQVPSGAQIVEEKYTYTRTDYTSSGAASLAGWTKYDTASAWSDYGSWSAWQDAAVSSSDSRNVETQQVIAGYNQKTQYLYSRAYGKNGSGKYVCYPFKAGVMPNYEETGWLDHSLPLWKDSAGDTYDNISGTKYFHYGLGYNPTTDTYNNYGSYHGQYLCWYNEKSRQVDDTNSPIYKTQYRYRDRSLIYTYYYYRNVNNLESTAYPSGDNISNVVNWVRYRAK